MDKELNEILEYYGANLDDRRFPRWRKKSS